MPVSYGFGKLKNVERKTMVYRSETFYGGPRGPWDRTSNVLKHGCLYVGTQEKLGK